jgi:general stress protein 26
LRPDERDELLRRPVVGVFSSISEGGWVHSVPVHFLYRHGEIRILCETYSRKTSNVDRTGRATLCVEVTEGTQRRYVTVEGPVRVERPASPADATALDVQYGRDDTAQWSEADYAGEAMLVLQPARWIACLDWD